MLHLLEYVIPTYKTMICDTGVNTLFIKFVGNEKRDKRTEKGTEQKQPAER